MTRCRLSFGPVAALAAALLGCVASQAAAQPAAAAATPDAERRAKALKLAQTVQPREMVVEQSMATLDEQAVEGLLADPNVRKMEDEHPGVVPAMWTAARPIIAEGLIKTLPDLWDGLAAVYAKHLTPAQLEETIHFFQSPIGRKFLIEMNRNTDVKPMMRDVVKPGDGRIGEKSYMETISGAATATAQVMTPAETAEFDRFFGTATGKVLLAMGPDVTRAVLEWSNRKDPEIDSRVEAAMVKAIERFIGADA